MDFHTSIAHTTSLRRATTKVFLAVQDGIVSRPTDGGLEESPLGTSERALQVDGLESIGSVFNCGTVGLGSFLVGAQCWLASVRGVKLEPALPTSVGSLFTADPHHVNGIGFDDFDWMFAD